MSGHSVNIQKYQRDQRPWKNIFGLVIEILRPCAWSRQSNPNCLLAIQAQKCNKRTTNSKHQTTTNPKQQNNNKPTTDSQQQTHNQQTHDQNEQQHNNKHHNKQQAQQNQTTTSATKPNNKHRSNNKPKTHDQTPNTPNPRHTKNSTFGTSRMANSCNINCDAPATRPIHSRKWWCVERNATSCNNTHSQAYAHLERGRHRERHTDTQRGTQRLRHTQTDTHTHSQILPDRETGCYWQSKSAHADLSLRRRCVCTVCRALRM